MTTSSQDWSDQNAAGEVTDSRSHLLWAYVVAVGGGVLTAHGLYEVAVKSGVPAGLAWIYPLITDGLALVAYISTPHLAKGARRYAASVVVIAATLSGVAQAVYLAGGAATPSQVLKLGVGGWPAICVAIVAHLVFLLREAQREARQAAAKRARQQAEQLERQRQAEADREHQKRLQLIEAEARAAERTRVEEPEKKAVAKKPASKKVVAKKPAAKASAPAPEIGKGSARQQMLDYLDEHAEKALAGQITGTDLDRLFGTSNYGRAVVRAWIDKHNKAHADGDIAVGE